MCFFSVIPEARRVHICDMGDESAVRNLAATGSRVHDFCTDMPVGKNTRHGMTIKEVE